MDPAHINSPQNCFKKIEVVLQQHEAQMTSATTEARQSAAAHEQALAVLAAKVS